MVTRAVCHLQERDPLHGSVRQGVEAPCAWKRSDAVEPDRLPYLEPTERASSRTCNEGRIPIVSRMGQSSSAFMAKPAEPQLHQQDSRVQLLLECPPVTFRDRCRRQTCRAAEGGRLGVDDRVWMAARGVERA